MKKEARLVTIVLCTRVVVNKAATDEEIIAAAKKGYLAKIQNEEILDNLVENVPDLEMPAKKNEPFTEPGFIPGKIYQPDLGHQKVLEAINKGDFASFFVYKEKYNAEQAWPGVKILEYDYKGIEEPTILDDWFQTKVNLAEKK